MLEIFLPSLAGSYTCSIQEWVQILWQYYDDIQDSSIWPPEIEIDKDKLITNQSQILVAKIIIEDAIIIGWGQKLWLRSEGHRG